MQQSAASYLHQIYTECYCIRIAHTVFSCFFIFIFSFLSLSLQHFFVHFRHSIFSLHCLVCKLSSLLYMVCETTSIILLFLFRFFFWWKTDCVSVLLLLPISFPSFSFIVKIFGVENIFFNFVVALAWPVKTILRIDQESPTTTKHILHMSIEHTATSIQSSQKSDKNEADIEIIHRRKKNKCRTVPDQHQYQTSNRIEWYGMDVICV